MRKILVIPLDTISRAAEVEFDDRLAGSVDQFVGELDKDSLGLI